MAFVVFGTIAGTNDQETFGMKQGTEKKKYQLAVLIDRNRDLKKNGTLNFMSGMNNQTNWFESGLRFLYHSKIKSQESIKGII